MTPTHICGTAAIDWGGLSRQPCPVCAKGPRDKALGVTLNPDGSGIAHCFRCEFIERRPSGNRLAGRTGRPATQSTPAKAVRRHETLSEAGHAILRACVRPAGTILERYLRARGLAMPQSGLWFHENLRHADGNSYPTAVAEVTDALTGELISLHMTPVNADGTKPAPRRLLGGHRKGGGCIRLWDDDHVTGGLGVGEGVETALALSRMHKPVWSVIDAGNLAQFPVIPGVEVLTVAVDHDRAGIEAAERCAERWHAAGREVFLVQANEPGRDLADLREAA